MLKEMHVYVFFFFFFTEKGEFGTIGMLKFLAAWAAAAAETGKATLEFKILNFGPG